MKILWKTGATLLLCLAAFASTVRAQPQAAVAPVLLVIGDSLSAEYGIARGTGWVSLLQQSLSKNGFDYNVVNASISGDTTSGGRARLAPLLMRYRPAVVIFELGANDALRGIPLSLTEQNLRDMVRAAKQIKSKVMVVGMRIPPNYGPDYSERFFIMYCKLAKSEHVAYAPFLLDGIAGRPDLFQVDQIHPVSAAQPRLLENVWVPLQPLLGKTGRARQH